MSLLDLRHYGQTRKAFTLIELVMVIGIIATLVVFSVSSYSSYRKSITLSLAVDSLQSAVKQIQQQARSGRTLENGATPCYGLVFVQGQPVRSVTAIYQKGGEGSLQETCIQETAGEPLTLMNGVSVAADPSANSSIDMRIFAIPPRGELLASGLDLNASSMHFRLQFGTDASKWVSVKMSLPFGILQRDSL